MEKNSLFALSCFMLVLTVFIGFGCLFDKGAENTTGTNDTTGAVHGGTTSGTETKNYSQAEQILKQINADISFLNFDDFQKGIVDTEKIKWVFVTEGINFDASNLSKLKEAILLMEKQLTDKNLLKEKEIYLDYYLHYLYILYGVSIIRINCDNNFVIIKNYYYDLNIPTISNYQTDLYLKKGDLAIQSLFNSFFLLSGMIGEGNVQIDYVGTTKIFISKPDNDLKHSANFYINECLSKTAYESVPPQNMIKYRVPYQMLYAKLQEFMFKL